MSEPASAEMFRNATQVNISGGTFTQISGNYHNQNNWNTYVSAEIHKQEALKRLFENIAPGAFHNSADRREPSKCHPHTREAVVRDILAWAQNPSNLRLLMWIYGPAGAGKSAIMQTIAELCDELDILGGSFFFLDGSDKRNVGDHLITTLSYQLAKKDAHFEDHVAATIHNDPSILSQNLGSQMKALILDPMAASVTTKDLNSSQQCCVILVDGLDECRLESSQREIINLLSNSASPHFRFIISSRPELAIRDSFSIPHVQNQTQTLALDKNYLPYRDIRRFLKDKFEVIKTSHILHHSLPQNWPDRSDIDKLVRNSSGQFIYAATIMRYIESPRHSPIEHLATVFKARLSPEQSDMPFAPLDALYHEIFSAVADITAVLNIIRILISDVSDCTDLCSWIETLLGYPSGQAQLVLCDMHSLLRFEDSDDMENAYIELHHKCLKDFLSDPLRSRNLYKHPKDTRQFIFINLLNHFDAFLRRFDNAEIWNTLKEAFSSWGLTLTTEAANTLLGCMPDITKAGFEQSQGNMGYVCQTLNMYYKWLNDQLSSCHLANKVYDASINLLDDQLSTLILRSRYNQPLLIIWIFSLKLSFTDIQNLVPFFCRSIFSDLNTDSQLILELRKLIANPVYKTKQMLNMFCDVDLAMTIIKYSFSQCRDSVYRFYDIEVERQEGTLAQFIIKHLPCISADAEVGEAISTIAPWTLRLPVIYYDHCTVGRRQCVDYEMCQQFRMHDAQLYFKQRRCEVSNACLSYLQRCSNNIEAHEYTSMHSKCFLCHSTQAFIDDPDFFAVHGILFIERPNTRSAHRRARRVISGP